MIPHEVWDKLLTPFDFTLYAVIRRLSGHGGQCFAGTKHLARMAKMSTGQVSISKARLRNLGLITHVGRFKRANHGKAVDHFTVGHWKPREQQRSVRRRERQPVEERSDHERKRSPGETEEDSMNNIPPYPPFATADEIAGSAATINEEQELTGQQFFYDQWQKWSTGKISSAEMASNALRLLRKMQADSTIEHARTVDERDHV